MGATPPSRFDLFSRRAETDRGGLDFAGLVEGPEGATLMWLGSAVSDAALAHLLNQRVPAEMIAAAECAEAPADLLGLAQGSIHALARSAGVSDPRVSLAVALLSPGCLHLATTGEIGAALLQGETLRLLEGGDHWQLPSLLIRSGNRPAEPRRSDVPPPLYLGVGPAAALPVVQSPTAPPGSHVLLFSPGLTAASDPWSWRSLLTAGLSAGGAGLATVLGEGVSAQPLRRQLTILSAGVEAAVPDPREEALEGTVAELREQLRTIEVTTRREAASAEVLRGVQDRLTWLELKESERTDHEGAELQDLETAVRDLGAELQELRETLSSVQRKQEAVPTSNHEERIEDLAQRGEQLSQRWESLQGRVDRMQSALSEMALRQVGWEQRLSRTESDLRTRPADALPPVQPPPPPAAPGQTLESPPVVQADATTELPAPAAPASFPTPSPAPPGPPPAPEPSPGSTHPGPEPVLPIPAAGPARGMKYPLSMAMLVAKASSAIHRQAQLGSLPFAGGWGGVSALELASCFTYLGQGQGGREVFRLQPPAGGASLAAHVFPRESSSLAQREYERARQDGGAPGVAALHTRLPLPDIDRDALVYAYAPPVGWEEPLGLPSALAIVASLGATLDRFATRGLVLRRFVASRLGYGAGRLQLASYGELLPAASLERGSVEDVPHFLRTLTRQASSATPEGRAAVGHRLHAVHLLLESTWGSGHAEELTLDIVRLASSGKKSPLVAQLLQPLGAEPTVGEQPWLQGERGAMVRAGLLELVGALGSPVRLGGALRGQPFPALGEVRRGALGLLELVCQTPLDPAAVRVSEGLARARRLARYQRDTGTSSAPASR